MKNLVTFVSVIILSASLLAQAPQMFSYQAVVRGVNNELVANKLVGMKISLLQGSESGSAVFIETHKPTANDNGLVSIAIGGGTLVKGTLANIDWSKGPYFIKTEIDPAGNSNYSLTSTSQLLSVPFALYAANAVPKGGSTGQILTNCNGVPTWTTGGVCPGKITALNCGDVINEGTITAQSETYVSSSISYNGGDGGGYFSQSIPSSGVTGLTAYLQAGNYAIGYGMLTFEITGKPNSSGIATFTINLGGVTCLISRNVNVLSETTKSNFITQNETWKSDSIYYLQGKVVVQPGVTLTIEPGTIIKGKSGVGTMSSALIITKGAKINAQGTALKPIIFTSELDNIKPAQFNGTNLEKTDNQKWGGLIILGNAPVSTITGDIEGNIEGIPANDNYGKYGGNNVNDNSGVLNYVSIRHAGALIGEGNEINGLTLGGVGNGTKIENIEVYATMDDGIECFGGSVNLKNILVYYQGDDAIDIDQNYSGTIENFMVIQGDGIATDKGLEVDGPENVTNNKGLFTFKNGLLKSEGKEGYPADFKDKAQGTVENVTFDYTTAIGKDLKIRANFDAANACATKTDAYTNLINGKLIFKGINLIGGAKPKVYMISSAIGCDLAGTEQDLATAKFITGAGASATIADFSWTNTSKKGELK